ncbi:hypothetical protein OH76DRAFT_1400623 [Lentinus brumalis]|uniref:Uncharacterized protein n=1 Tax=Lentinus brumalis TaxID=2498619 RepID=A0A371DID5_9APHY|nr:hypothetical protein OH76DRAFT_1400623 [Polyporus brumalis]
MASSQQKPRTWYYGFRFGHDEAMELANKVRETEPNDLEKLAGLPEDLSPLDEGKPSNELPADWLAEVWIWGIGYVQAEAGPLPYILERLKPVAIPDTTHSSFTRCHVIYFAEEMAVNAPDPDFTAHRDVNDSIARVRKVLSDDQEGWYQEWFEYSPDHAKKALSNPDKPSAS